MDFIVNFAEYVLELLSDIDFSDIYGIIQNVIDAVGKMF